MFTLGLPEGNCSKPLQNVPIYVASYLRTLYLCANLCGIISQNSGVYSSAVITNMWAANPGRPHEIIQNSANMTSLDRVDYMFLHYCPYCYFSNEEKIQWLYNV